MKSTLAKVKWFSIFTGPALIAFLCVMVIPFFYGIYMTFTDWDALADTYQYVGLRNYALVFSDRAFHRQFLVTFRYVISSTILVNIFAFILAWLLTSGIRAQSFLRAGFFTPNLIGGIVLGYIWRFLFANVFTLVGKSLGIEALSTSFLSHPERAVSALIIVTVWQYAGYLMVIYIAGIVSIPKEIEEAASIDGASGLRKLFLITIPLMLPAFVICIFISLSRGFIAYDLNLSLTNGAPYGSTQLAAMYVYQQAFLARRYGLGQAEAMVLFLVVAVATVTQVQLTKRYEVEA
jgi:raffinose/stachyose/melibiose transport system permease protein